MTSKRDTSPSQTTGKRRLSSTREKLRSFSRHKSEGYARVSPRLLARFEKDIARLRGGQLEDWRAAQLTLNVLRDLLQRETKQTSLRDAIDVFCSALWAGPRFRGFLEELERRCLGVLYQFDRMVPDSASLSLAFSADLCELLTFYQQRKAVIKFLADLGDGDREALYGFNIVHDRAQMGLDGFEVRCGARLRGRFSQPLWFKVQLRQNGDLVSCNRAWGTWIDSAKPLREAREAGSAPFTALLPVVPDAQNVIIENIRAFIPYAALNLSAGQNEIVVEASLVDEDEAVLLQASQTDMFYIPAAGSREIAVQAPQALSIWPFDSVTGDGFSDLKAGVRKVEDSKGDRVITLDFDLSLFGHAGESLLMECRLLDACEELVDCSLPHFCDERGAFLFRERVRPYSMVSRFRNLAMQIPLHCLDLPPGKQVLFCELVIYDPQSRVICGALHRIDCFVAEDRVSFAIEKEIQSGEQPPYSPAVRNLPTPTVSQNGHH